MNSFTRREFLARNATLAAAGVALQARPRLQAAAEPWAGMRISLSPGSIGVSANQREALALAQRHGFEAVEPYGDFLAGLAEGQLQELLADLKAKGLVWGAAGLPVEFRQDDAKFADSMKGLPRIADGLQRAGATRVGTWLMPGHASLTYLQNFRQHARRLREAATVLKDRGQRLGLEYVGTPRIWRNQRYPFVHTLAETKDLIAEIGTGNVGVVLDSWHWTMAGDTEADLLALRPEDIVSVDLNDAPAGVPKDDQQDGKRELPCATGVIDVATFLRALQHVGYDGPVRCEPFNKALNDLDNEAACAATAAAMKKAFALR
jgi:sugar phosphate isomerase/epimerase